MRLLSLLFCASLLPAQPFHLDKTISLPGVEGRLDHMSVDPAGKRLIVAALGNNTVEVVDIAAGARIRSLTGMREPQGIVYAADSKKIYVASGQDGKLRVYDAATLKLTGELAVGEDADNVRYEAGSRRIWVAYGNGAIAIVNAATLKKLSGIPLDAHPESFQLETSGPRIFANVPGASEIQVLDREKRTILAKWPVKEAAANFPMALDEPGGRLFVGCRKPAKVLVFNTADGKLTAQFPCPGDTDDLFYDAARKRLYVVGGEGLLEAFDDQYRPIAKLATAPGARTGLYSPDLNQFFVAVPHRGNQGAEIRVYSVQ